MLVGFVIAKFLSPEDLGLWSTILLALTYSVFIQGGVINGLNVELPAAYGRDDVSKAEKLAAVAQTFTLLTCIVALVVGVATFFLLPTDNSKLRYGILGITFIIILTFYQNYLLSTFRSNNSFAVLSKIQLAEALLNIISISLVVYFAYYGMIFKAALVLLAFVLLLHINRPIKTNFYWDKSIFIHLLKVGLPIFILVVVESFLQTIDKIWLIKYADLNTVGLYSFGLYALNLFILLSTSIATYIYPKMTYAYAKNNDKLALWQYMKKITFLLLAVQTPLVIIGYFLIPPVVKEFFPTYMLSIEVMQILLIAGLMKGSVIGVNILWSMKSWKYMYLYMITYALLTIVSTYLFLHLNENKMLGVSIGLLIANALSLLNAYYLSFKATHSNISLKN